MNVRRQKVLSLFGALVLANLALVGLLAKAVTPHESVSTLNHTVTFTDEQVSALRSGQSVRVAVDRHDRSVRLESYTRVSPVEISCVVPKDDDDYVVDRCATPQDSWLGVAIFVLADVVLLLIWLVLRRPRPLELWRPSHPAQR
ncbi:hypothetical protein [Terracoccus sp. 273MFTsu3.1]|uniref:hypothetical protein n=1 Tax=Terracoccus sp. 273MFTsu3.1 TaxID=1172188 RepID=UPI000365C7B1|nr:hypothetical protein [Terracoccus sp. 273MFTsu3.1]